MKTYESGENANGNPPAAVAGQRGFSQVIIEPRVNDRNLSLQTTATEERGCQVGDRFGLGEFVVFIGTIDERDALRGEGILQDGFGRNQFLACIDELLRAVRAGEADAGGAKDQVFGVETCEGVEIEFIEEDDGVGDESLDVVDISGKAEREGREDEKKKDG